MTFNTYKLKSFRNIRKLDDYYFVDITIVNDLNKEFISLFDLELLEKDVMNQINLNLKNINKYYNINKNKPTYFFQFILTFYDEPRNILISKPYFCPLNHKILITQWLYIIQHLIETYNVIALKQITLKVFGKNID